MATCGLNSFTWCAITVQDHKDGVRKGQHEISAIEDIGCWLEQPVPNVDTHMRIEKISKFLRFKAQVRPRVACDRKYLSSNIRSRNSESLNRIHVFVSVNSDSPVGPLRQANKKSS
jgi:hypothetical protein